MMSLVEQQWCPTSVQVTVQQARGLRIKGKSGTNDAYAVMQVGKEKYQTTVAEKSVAPVWREEAAFDLPPLLQQGGGGGGGILHVHVLHRALVGPDKLLGQAVINLLQLSEDETRNKTEWFKLLDKTGKADKDRGEVLVDIQFMRNNMTASMFDLSAAGKSRSRLGKIKDKVRGKKKESDTVSNLVPSFGQVLTDSEEEGNGEVASGKGEKKKKHKMKSLFSHKSNLQKNMSQSMSVLPAKNSSLSGSQSSGLNVDSSEGKKKFKFLMHKRSGSSDSKESSSGHQKHGAVEQSNLCINGSHVYCEEPQARTSRIGSNFSLASSGHGSMEDVPESSPPSVDSQRAVRQYSPWTEEEEEGENIKEDADELRREEEEMMKMEEEKRRKEEDERRAEEEKVKREERRKEEVRAQEERRQREEEERIRREEERAEEERRRREEEERIRREEERAEEERRRREEEEKIRREKERAEEVRRQEEEERVRRQEQEESARRQEEVERVRRQEEEERARRQEEEERARRQEEVERIRREKERAEEERRRQEEEERIRREEERAEEEERVRRQEEEERVRRQEEEERARRQEEEDRARRQEEEERVKKQEEEERERRRQEEEEMVRRQKEEREEKRRLEEQERMRMEERAEEVRRRQAEEDEEERAKRREEERMLVEEKKRIEEERVKKEEEELMRRQKEELEEQKRRQREEEERLKEEEEERERKRIEAEEKIRVEEERRMKEEEEERIRKQEECEKRILEEQQKRRIEREERQQREEEEMIRKQEERRQEEEERARKEKEEYERLVEKTRLEEVERRRTEDEERIRREQMAEEEARKLEKEKLKREAEEQTRKETKHKAAGKKPNMAMESPADVTSTNPFDEISDSKVSTIQESAQQEKRRAPHPPGRKQAESQKEQDGSTRHLAQINTKSKDKDIKTVSVLPQRSVQVIAPLSRSPTDAKQKTDAQSLTQSGASKETSNVASKRPAPSIPHSVDQGLRPDHKAAPSSSDGNIPREGGSQAKQAPISYGLNPFEDDEDENAAEGDAATSGSVQWPPEAGEDTTSKTKIKSSKAHAPPLPAKKAVTVSASVQSTEGGRASDDAADKVKDPGEETGWKKDGPPVPSRRLQPVKPLNPLEQQSVSVVQGEKDDKSAGILCEVQEKTKVTGSALKGPYSQLTQEELICLVRKQENLLSERDKKISELEQYIDNLLVRVMEDSPNILMSLNSLKKAA